MSSSPAMPLRRPPRSRSRSPSSSSSTSSGSDSSAYREKKRRRKEEKRQRKAEKKRLKKERKRASKPLTLTHQWGKYGIIRTSDKFTKANEFNAWLADVKEVVREELSLKEEADLFAQYTEDYNTATLPHKKYYDLARWEQKQLDKQTGKRSKKHKSRHKDQDDGKDGDSGQLRDEEVLRLERLRQMERKTQEAEHMRVQALVQSLKRAKGTQH
ncbi:Uncharacterized protein PBTT_00395 [Plasmodiophora brassicae]